MKHDIGTAPVRNYTTIDSTSLEARRLHDQGAAAPVFLRADVQTAGRGRMDRPWISPVGNCYSTLVLPLEAPISVASQIGFVTSLAVHTVVATALPLARVQLKWPNDVLVNGAKIAGILSEIISQAPLVIAIGCGINVAHAPEGLAYPATSMAAQGSTWPADQVFASYKQSLAEWLDVWDGGKGFAHIKKAWCDHAIGIGETVSMATGHQKTEGCFEGITAQGAIILKPPHGTPHILHAGDLHIPSLATLRTGTP